jgi:ferredoxin
LTRTKPLPKAAGYEVATLNDVAKEDRLIVSFEASGVQATWEPSCHSLLELAEQAGLTVPFNCRAGLCNTCLTPLLQGEVEYAEPPLEQPGDGEVLMCCARPLTPVTLRL